MNKIAYGIICSILLLLGLIWFGGSFIVKQLAIDSCLDSGGRWNYQTNECDK